MDESKKSVDELCELVQKVFPFFFHHRNRISELIPLVAGRLSVIKIRAYDKRGQTEDDSIVPDGFLERALVVREYTYYTGHKFLEMVYDFGTEKHADGYVDGVLYFEGVIIGQWLEKEDDVIYFTVRDTKLMCPVPFWIENIAPIYKELQESEKEIRQALFLLKRQEQERKERELKERFPPPPDKIRT